MQQRPLGRAGLLVSRLALGTMTWGRDTAPDDAAAQLKTFVAAGGTLLDTADVYGDGEAEAVIGGLLSTAVSRDDILIATKAGLRPARERRRDTPRGHPLRVPGASPTRHGRPADSRAASPHFERFVTRYLDPRSSAIVESVVTAAQGLGVSPLEVALAWVRDRPGVVAPILGARTVGQLLGALQVEEITLPAEISRALADVSAIECGYPERQG